MFLVFENQLFDAAKVMCLDSTIVRQPNAGIEPEFALAIRRPDVNVCRLISFVGVKVKPK
jgi:hypothetical protein